MISKLVLLFSFSLFLLGMAVADTRLIQRSKAVQRAKEVTPRSCLDYLKNGFTSDGYYSIYDFKTLDFITVYCDMNSEPGAAWTLVMSYAKKNMRIEQFTKHPLKTDKPVNKHSPNWNLYRMSWSQMNHVKSQSTHWRATCSFPTHGVDYTDYVRAKFAQFDVMTFLGHGICKSVEYVNIRGHQCAQCTARWWQVLNAYAAHIDSSATGCQLVPTQGASSSENNFGYYLDGANNAFRCTAGPTSTTNWWFGGYL